MGKVDPQKHAERRLELLEAARRCFARDGFRGASISDICAEASISPGHLYHYFDSKEDIVRSITQSSLSRADTHFELISQSDDLIARLVARIEDARAGHRDAAHFLVFDMLAEAGHNPTIAKILCDHNQTLRSRFAAFLRKGQEDGKIDRSLDPDLAASILISAVDGAKAMNIRDPKLSKEGTNEHLKMLITRYLKPPRD